MLSVFSLSHGNIAWSLEVLEKHLRDWKPFTLNYTFPLSYDNMDWSLDEKLC